MIYDGRQVPRDKTAIGGVFVHSSRLGEVVQKLSEDGDVVSFEIEAPATRVISNEWFVKFRFDTQNTRQKREEVARRLFELLEENPTFRIVIDGKRKDIFFVTFDDGDHC